MPAKLLSEAEYRALAELRYRMRAFLGFSETEARAVGIEPQQHQLLLAIRGLPAEEQPTIRTLADRLVLRHHTVVGLVDRLERRQLVKREASDTDRRVVLVRIRPRGRALLDRLSLAHRDELAKTGPALLAALHTLVGNA